MCNDFENGKKNRIKLIKQGLIKGKNYVSFSAGKDSTAMLLKIQENKVFYDEIVFADTGFEYPELYAYIEYLEKNYDLKLTTLKPKTFRAEELFNKNKEVKAKLEAKGVEVVDLDFYPSEWTKNTIISLWDYWFYGIVSKGANGGTIRSYPITIAGHCWYSREAKVNPLQKKMEDASNIFVGIASDETKRQKATEKDHRLRHYLTEIGMTELECAKFLQGKKLHNPIYDRYNRSGCFQCPKQNQWGLYMQWKNSPELWEQTKHWDNEGRRLRGQGGFIDRKTKEEIKIFELEENFRLGHIPDKNLKYECHSCSNIFD